jgi:hypothetical protein
MNEQPEIPKGEVSRGVIQLRKTATRLSATADVLQERLVSVIPRTSAVLGSNSETETPLGTPLAIEIREIDNIIDRANSTLEHLLSVIEL